MIVFPHNDMTPLVSDLWLQVLSLRSTEVDAPSVDVSQAWDSDPEE